MNKQETALEREISTLAWDYKSREYRARSPHRKFAYTTVWRVLKKRPLEQAVEFLEKVSTVYLDAYTRTQNKQIWAIYKQALQDIKEAKEYTA